MRKLCLLAVVAVFSAFACGGSESSKAPVAALPDADAAADTDGGAAKPDTEPPGLDAAVTDEVPPGPPDAEVTPDTPPDGEVSPTPPDTGPDQGDADAGAEATLLPCADGDDCDDGDPCTTDDKCTAGACAGVPDDCDDGDPCTDDLCALVGCAHLPNTDPCDDGNACTAGDACKNGLCVSGDTADCDDMNPCTIDGCSPLSGCANDPIDMVPCDDGDACTEGESCDSGVCAGLVVDCDDGNACTGDSCDHALGCINTATAGSCDDGNECTKDDSCDPVTSACHGAPVSCGDGDPCTDDSCDPVLGCVHDVVPDSVCGDGYQCTIDWCEPLAGCMHKNADTGTPCDDGLLCTTSDTCDMGVCSGAPADCGDGDDCTSDACKEQVGCVHEPVAGCP